MITQKQKDLLKEIVILYVEDEQELRNFTASTLKNIVKDIITANNGLDGIEKFKENKDIIDVIVTDINMPKLDGLEMYKQIKEIKKVPCVVTSAYNDSSFLHKSIEYGISSYSMKPINIIQLIEAIVKAYEPFYLRRQLELYNQELENKVKEQISQIRAILDNQKSLIALIDHNSYELINANKKFLDFFDVSSIKEFKEKYICIINILAKDIKIDIVENKIDILNEILSQTHIVTLYSKGQEFIFDIDKSDYVHNNSTFSVLTFNDITELKKSQEKLQYQATHDFLTKLFNRNKLIQILKEEIKRYKRYKNPLSIIMFDIDHFKQVNDTYGHDKGDIVLQTISDVAKNSIRSQDYIARWGGEEFMIITIETPLKFASLVAEKIRNKIKSTKIDEVGEVSASFGVTEFKDDDTLDSFLKRVDIALYEAKENGRDRVVAK